jgi:type II secretion system protein H
MQKGFTLIEGLVVLVLIGLITAIVLPGATRTADRVAVQYQVARIQAAYRQAWSVATSRRRLALLRITPDSIAIRTVRGAGEADTVLLSVAPGPRSAGVELLSPSHTTVFGPDGIGLGAANTTHILARGAITRRIVVSRLGRVRLQ